MMNELKIGNLTVRYPIIQGGMGVGISLSGLASAIANEGGVGVIAAAGLGLFEKDYKEDYLGANIRGLQKQIRDARSKTSGVVGVNIMVALSNFADLVKTAVSEKVDIIFSGAGLPLNMPQFLSEDSHTKLVPIVSSARAAQVLCKKWKEQYDYLPDAIVVEGPKAGGHLGFKPSQIEDPAFALEKLIPAVIAEVRHFEELYNVRIPVIAAGGIYTGEDILRFLNMGAAGVQMGTRFVTTHECDASDGFKQSYIEATKDDIEIIISPIGMPGRAIHSKFIDQINAGKKRPLKCPYKCIRTCDIDKTPYCIVGALMNAMKGNFFNGYAFAGANAYLSTKIISVKETFQALQAEFMEAVSKHRENV